MAHRRTSLVGILALTLALLSSCQMERRKSDAELGLNPEQAQGRRIYDQHCIRCHEPYSGRELQGPSLRGIFKKKTFPNGMPANDARMTDMVMFGRAKMPSFRDTITPDQMQALLAYLHTL